MPDYNWVCHVCEAVNPKGTETCAACGKPAVMSANEINPPKPDQKAQEEKPLNPVFLFLCGAYLLVGSGYTFVTGKWFMGFPAQLDLVRLLAFESPAGTYGEAALAALLGAICFYAIYFERRRGNT
jgi:hypothetical protein